MKNRRALTEGEESPDINISPLIDMVFILLIFFIVTTVFVEETGVEVHKPKAASAQQLEKKSILIAVTANGNVVYGGRQIGVDGVRPLVERLLQERDVPVILKVDEGARAGRVVRVLDQAKLAGAKKVSLASERPQT